MENLEDLKLRLGELGLTSDQIDEAMEAYKPQKTQQLQGLSVNDRVFALQQEIEKATDWKEKVRLQARIIVEKYDEY